MPPPLRPRAPCWPGRGQLAPPCACCSAWSLVGTKSTSVSRFGLTTRPNCSSRPCPFCSGRCPIAANHALTPVSLVCSQMISNFLDIADMNLNSTVTRLLNDYNMKPILTRPQHHFFTDGSTYFEVNKRLHSHPHYLIIFIFCKCFRARKHNGPD